MKKIIAFLLIFVTALGCFGSCKKYDEEEKIPPTNKELIADRIETFLTAYNTGNMDGVLACLDAKTRNAFEAMMNLFGGMAGSAIGFNIDLSDLFSLGVSMTQGDFMGLEIKDINVIDSSNAIATTVMSLTGAGTQTIYFVMVYENDGWYINDMTDRKPTGADSNQGESTDGSDSAGTNDEDNSNTGTGSGGNVTVSKKYKISTCEQFLDERAWVTYYEEVENQYPTTHYYGFIDMEGNVIYSTSTSGVNVYNIGKGSAIIISESELVLIDENGEVKMRLDGRAEVKHCGGGFAWIYQNKSTITSLEHLYGIVDYKGVWINPLNNLSEAGLYNDMDYIGEGFLGARGRRDVIYPIWNADNSVLITIDGYVSDRHIEFINGVALVNSSHFWDDTISITVTKTDENGVSDTVLYENIKYDCLLFPDGRVLPLEKNIVSLDYDKAFYDGKTMEYIPIPDTMYSVKGNYKITDYTKNPDEWVEFTAYPIAMIKDVVFNGDYGLVEILGLDEETYVVLIDTEGNELIAPIKGKYVDEFILAPDGYAYYRKDGVYYIIDKNGNVTKTDITWYVSFDNSGIGMISNYLDHISYIKPNGESLFEYLAVK